MSKLVRLNYNYDFYQIPYYWPCSQKNPDNVEYAIYLSKRLLRNKQRHALEDYEMVIYTKKNHRYIFASIREFQIK